MITGDLLLLFRNQLRLMAWRYVQRGLCRQSEMEDLIQEGYVGILEAATRYDQGRGHFAPYALSVAKGRMAHYVRDRAQVVRAHRPFVWDAQSGRRKQITKFREVLDFDDIPQPATIEQGFDDAEVRATVQRIPNPRLRWMTELYVLDRLPQTAVAQRLHISQKHVSRLFHRLQGMGVVSQLGG